MFWDRKVYSKNMRMISRIILIYLLREGTSKTRILGITGTEKMKELKLIADFNQYTNNIRLINE